MRICSNLVLSLYYDGVVFWIRWWFIYSCTACFLDFLDEDNNCHFHFRHPSFFLLPTDLPEFMLKRMASKISSHIHNRKPVQKADAIPIPIPELSSASSSTLSHIPTMPDYRGSISTNRTSASQDDTEEIVETRRVRLPQRPKGTYRLSDFIIQRTLGTGSFGRVHLGMYFFYPCSTFLLIQFCSSSQ